MDNTTLQAIIDRSPLNRWLSLSVQEITPETVTLTMPWREELVSNPHRQAVHGGVLATLIDGAGDYAIAVRHGQPVPTLTLHVDYHRTARPGPLQVRARVLHMGSRIATAEAFVHDEAGTLVASGRATYLVA